MLWWLTPHRLAAVQLKFFTAQVTHLRDNAKFLRKNVKAETLLGGSESLGMFEEQGDSFGLALGAFNGSSLLLLPTCSAAEAAAAVAAGLHETWAVNNEI